MFNEAWQTLRELHDLAMIPAVIWFVITLYHYLKERSGVLYSILVSLLQAFAVWLAACIAIYCFGMELYLAAWAIVILVVIVIFTVALD